MMHGQNHIKICNAVMWYLSVPSNNRKMRFRALNVGRGGTVICETGEQPFARINSNRVFQSVSSSQNFRYLKTKALYQFQYTTDDK